MRQRQVEESEKVKRCGENIYSSRLTYIFKQTLRTSKEVVHTLDREKKYQSREKKAEKENKRKI